MGKLIKWLLKVAALVVFGGLAAVIAFAILSDLYFKTSIKYSDKVYVVMYDKEIQVSSADADKLKQLILSKRTNTFGEPSCGFGIDYSIKFTNTKAGILTVYVCPACDMCPIFKIGGACYEYSDKTRIEFEDTVEKYGMEFPNI